MVVHAARAAAAATPTTALVEVGPKAIVGSALVGVRKDGVGLANLLELGVCAVGVIWKQREHTLSARRP
jgi:hypothetical protein